MVYFTLYIVTTLAALGSVFKLGPKKTENRFDPLIFFEFIITQMNHDPLYI